MLGLDQDAVRYARLLADPCMAPLAHPVYPGGDAGFLFRAETFATYALGATNTSGVIHWTPGYVNATNTELVGFSADNSFTATTTTTPGNAVGAAFLGQNAKGCRCVAACLKITYPGSESSRSGRIHYGHTNASYLDSGDSRTVDAVAQGLQHYTRTPPEVIELIWKPNVADAEFNDPTEAAGALIRDRKAALTVAWAGLPAGVGITFHFTAVYEWTPKTGLGVGHNALGKNQSSNTLDQVLDSLVNGGFRFVRHAAAVGGQAIGTGIVNGIASVFGNMPARPSTRSAGYFLV